MDSKITSKINSLQRDLGELELKESTLQKDLEAVQSKIKLIKKELAEISGDERVTRDILERVYEQRRSPFDSKKK